MSRDIERNLQEELSQVLPRICELYETTLPALLSEWVKRFDDFDEKLRIIKNDGDKDKDDNGKGMDDRVREQNGKTFTELSDPWMSLWRAVEERAAKVTQCTAFCRFLGSHNGYVKTFN